MTPAVIRVLIFALFIWGAYVISRRARTARTGSGKASSIPIKPAIQKITDPLDGATALMIALARMDDIGKISPAQDKIIRDNLQTHMQQSASDADKRIRKIDDFSRHLNRAQSVIVPAIRTLHEKLTKKEIEELVDMLIGVAQADSPMNKDQKEFIGIVKDELTGAKTNPGYQLAQINIAHFRKPSMNTVNNDFHAAIDGVNDVAESQPGFIWRLIDDAPQRADTHMFQNPDMLVNLSVWADMESLMKFVYRTPIHREIMRRREEWFDHVEFNIVLWWIKAGELPTLKDAEEKLNLLAARGATDEAFTFKTPFPPPSGPS